MESRGLELRGRMTTRDPIPTSDDRAIPAGPVAENTRTVTKSARSAKEPDASLSVRAFALGLVAAATYSVANLALRGLSRSDGAVGWDMWIAGLKAFPTFAVAMTLLSLRWWRGESLFAAWHVVQPVAIAALFNQLGGNFAFQMSLGTIGLAISVPICFASIICSGAVVGRTVLGDPVSVRTAVSMGLMVFSIVFLSAAARSRDLTESVAPPVVANASQVLPAGPVDSEAVAIDVPAAARRRVVAGVALSILSGLCYGVTGVFIRKAVRSDLPVAATLFLFSAAGFLVLTPLSLLLLPSGAISGMTRGEWLTAATAGIFNAIGFFAITHAMRSLTISRANVINASQNAMCAIGAVLVFGESISAPGLLGIGLTIAGLLVLDRR
jgi:drug/metabolite transporter (DMT)-like permease